mgnify:CR=1 FL=1
MRRRISISPSRARSRCGARVGTKVSSALATEGRVYAADLCRLLRVSEDTVRRDLRELDEAGIAIPFPQMDVHLNKLYG